MPSADVLSCSRSKEREGRGVNIHVLATQTLEPPPHLRPLQCFLWHDLRRQGEAVVARLESISNDVGGLPKH